MSKALREFTGESYKLQVYTEHNLRGQDSESTAVAYIGLEMEDGTMCWGVGIDTDNIRAGAEALLSAYNNIPRK